MRQDPFYERGERYAADLAQTAHRVTLMRGWGDWGAVFRKVGVKRGHHGLSPWLMTQRWTVPHALACGKGLETLWIVLGNSTGVWIFVGEALKKRFSYGHMEHHFADCTLDDARLTLTRGGSKVAVEPKVFDLIHLLVRNAGDLVTRDRMVEEVWDGRVVSESAISACIAGARKAVGDTGKEQAVIRTVARRGLMLVAEVEGDANAPDDVSVAAPSPTTTPAAQRIRFCRSEDGNAIAYAVSGEGTPVLRFGPPSLHDLELEWAYGLHRSWISSMALYTRYLRFDNVGSGQSERVLRDLDFEIEARDAAAVVDAAGFDRFAAVSYSGGCIPALTFAALYPERLERLAIVGGYVEGRSRRSADPSPDALKSMIAEGWARPESAFASGFATTYFPEGPVEERREIQHMSQAACPPEMMLRARESVNNATVAHLLGQVRCPVLILHARDDSVHPLSQAQKLAAGIPGAELVVLETANHVPLYGSPCWESYNRTLAEFLIG